MNFFTFEEQLKRGQELQDIVTDFFKEKNTSNTYIDVSNNQTFRDIDVDLLEIDKEKRVNTIEIKCDETFYKDCNLFVEYISCKRLNSDGWLYKTKAEYICYVFTKRGFYFMIPTEKIKEIVTAYEFVSKEAHDEYKTSIGYIIPSTAFIEYRIDDLELAEKFKDFYKKV